MQRGQIDPQNSFAASIEDLTGKDCLLGRMSVIRPSEGVARLLVVYQRTQKSEEGGICRGSTSGSYEADLGTNDLSRATVPAFRFLLRLRNFNLRPRPFPVLAAS